MKKITLSLTALVTTAISGNTYQGRVPVKEKREIIYVKGMAARTCEPAIRFNNTSIEEVLLISASDSLPEMAAGIVQP